MTEPNWGSRHSRLRPYAATVRTAAILVASTMVGCRNSDDASRDDGAREIERPRAEGQAEKVTLTTEAIERADAEVRGPLATVVIGGIISSTF